MRRRLTKRAKNKRSKQIIIISTICLLIVMVSGYAAFQTNLSITAKGNIKEPSRVIQSWTSTSQEDFHSDYYKENIVSATFLDNVNVPDNATESWNVSEDKKHGGVMAWVIPTAEDSTKYDLYIGANKGVIANDDSSYLFNRFIKLMSIDFQDNFDTSHVIDMSAMFSAWNYSTHQRTESSLLEIKGLNNFITNNVQIMYAMFDGNDKLKEINVSNFNTSNLLSMGSMFNSCSGLETLDLSNFDTSKVTNMYGTFNNCQSLVTLDLSSFDTSNVVTMYDMFNNMLSLTTIYVSDSFVTTKVNPSDHMFENSLNLIGGNGTKYSSAHKDKEYARIDTPSTPGYFTLKN